MGSDGPLPEAPISAIFITRRTISCSDLPNAGDPGDPAPLIRHAFIRIRACFLNGPRELHVNALGRYHIVSTLKQNNRQDDSKRPPTNKDLVKLEDYD